MNKCLNGWILTTIKIDWRFYMFINNKMNCAKWSVYIKSITISPHDTWNTLQCNSIYLYIKLLIKLYCCVDEKCHKWNEFFIYSVETIWLPLFQVLKYYIVYLFIMHCTVKIIYFSIQEQDIWVEL